MDHIDRIYVLVHPVHEKERYERLVQHLSQFKFPPSKIALGSATWGTELTSEQIFSVWDPFCRKGLPNLTWKSRCLSKGEVSLVLNFYAAASDAVANNFKSIIILESDVFLRSDFIERLNDLWNSLEGPWDYVSLGEGIGTRPDGVVQSYWSPTRPYKPPHQFVFRCTDSMLLNVAFLKKVLQTLMPFRECLDWELNYQLAAHHGIAYWADPPLVEQGSSRNREPSLLPA